MKTPAPHHHGHSSEGPPRLAAALLAWSAPAPDREPMLGDLAEEWAARRDRHGAPAARRWYWLQLLHSLAPNLRRRWRAGMQARRPTHLRSPADGPMATLWHDLRYALRTLRRAPTFSVLAALTLALGIGASTVVYSVVDGVVLRPFPYPDPERLVGIGPAFPRIGRELSFWEVLSPAEYQDVAAQSRTLERVVAWDMGNRHVGADEAPERVFAGFWWGDAFRTLEVRPALGRGFDDREIAEGASVAVISHRLWQRLYGGDSALVGRTISVNGEPHTLVGVMPPRTLVYGTDLWTPMPIGPEVFPRARRQFQLLARLAPGATLEQANAELATIARRIEQEHGAEHEEYVGWSLTALGWTDINVRTMRPAALVLLGAVGFVLLLVCVNVASLLLARAAARRLEMAVRGALGASRPRLLRQLLTESVLLALAGGAVGVLLAVVGTRALADAMASLTVPVPGEIAVNLRVLVVTAAVCVLAGILFGLAPALHAARADLQGMLKGEGGAIAGGAARHRLQRLFVGVEVALAIVLLAGGGLLVNSFVRLQAVDPGFAAEEVLTMRLTLPPERYQGPAITAFFQTLAQQVAAIPGVRVASAGSQFPPGTFMRREFRIEGEPARGDGALPSAFATLAGDGYFETLGIPVLRGRVPDSRDTEETPLVGAINEAAVRRWFPDRDPIGRHLVLGDDPERRVRIVGVVGDTRNVGLEREPQPELFGSLRQNLGGNQHFLLVRTTVPPRSVLPQVREVVHALDAQQPVYAVQTADEAFAVQLLPRRLATVTLTLFGGFALALAAVGIFGVVSYAVSERTREIGVRMALGAEAGQLRRLMVRQALLPAAIGGAVGLALALGAGTLLRGLLYGVGSTDPLTLASVVALFALVAVVAGYIPARRASRLDPVRALRD